MLKYVFTFAIISLITLTTNAAPVNGAQKFSGLLNPSQKDKYRLVLKENEITTIVVKSNDADIDCEIYDENFNLVDEDNDPTHTCILTINPRWTGVFFLFVKNPTNTSAVYAGIAK